MSSYHQFCGVARSLDLIGDRWTLLIVRELLVRPRRFSELVAGLPGVATNLLSGRLTELQRDGIVERRLAERGSVYALTPWGEGLREVLASLIRWCVPAMATGPLKDDTFHADWLHIALDAFLADARAARSTTVALTCAEARFVITAGPEGTKVREDPDARAEAELRAPGPLLTALASGVLTVDELAARGATVEGDRAAFDAIFGRGALARTEGS
ncbi:MAG: transcriptional regulator [Salinibacterium sp.]|nr:MAG: transcriptional regulator [Salinibacterium sp.]